MSELVTKIELRNITRIQLYVNHDHKTVEQIKQETHADYILNGGLFNPNWTACALLKVDDAMQSDAPWRAFGYGWNTPKDIALRTDYENVRNFISCVCLLRNGKRENLKSLPAALDGARQRSAIGLVNNSIVLYCTNESTTPGLLQREMERMGCDSAVMLDGGGSSQCDFHGMQITSRRVVQNLILVYLTDNDKYRGDCMTDCKTVCLDPGHGPGCHQGSPDGTYKERFFAWDMYKRLRFKLEEQGIKVVGTKSREDTLPSLTARAATSNRANADLFISLHSNAAGGSGWSDAHGLSVYTSAPGGERQRAAECLVAECKKAGIDMRNPPIKNRNFTVLVKTHAPAILVEHAFHTNKHDLELLKNEDHRNLLATLECKAVCNFLGVAYKEKDEPEPIKDRDIVQQRFLLSDATMDYLEAYTYGADLLRKLAEGK